MIQVIVVEDHLGLREDIVFGLNAEGLRARGAADGREFDALCADQWPDVAVLDIMLLGEDGLAIARRMRAHAGIGIVMLTARSEIDDRVAGLDVADSYLVKPVNIRELAAVVRSVHRRTSKTEPERKNTVWMLSENRMELVSPGGTVLGLSHKECRLLCALAKASGKVVPTKALVEALEENWLMFDKNRLEVFIGRLRRKIAAAMTDPINPIKPARNEGYALAIQVKATQR